MDVHGLGWWWMETMAGDKSRPAGKASGMLMRRRGFGVQDAASQPPQGNTLRIEMNTRNKFAWTCCETQGNYVVIRAWDRHPAHPVSPSTNGPTLPDLQSYWEFGATVIASIHRRDMLLFHFLVRF